MRGKGGRHPRKGVPDAFKSEPDLPHPAGIGHSAGVEEPAVRAYFCASLAVGSLFSIGAPHHTLLSRRHGSDGLGIVAISDINSATQEKRVAPRAPKPSPDVSSTNSKMERNIFRTLELGLPTHERCFVGNRAMIFMPVS